MNRIAVVGAGIAVPGAHSLAELWELLYTGGPVFSEPGERFGQDSFWAADPGAEDRTYVRTSGFLRDLRAHPQLAEELARGRFAPADREAVWLRHCLLLARDSVAVRDGDVQALLVGGSVVTSQGLDEEVVTGVVARGVAERLPEAAQASQASPDVEASRLRGVLNEHFGRGTGCGPVRPDQVIRAAAEGLLPADSEMIMVDTACSSSLYSIDLGIKLLRQGRCDVVYCGGLSSVTPRYNVAFAKLGGLTRAGRIRSFEREADGTLFSDGAAVIALKTLERARADGDRILAVVAGFGASSDGRGKAVFAANPAGQVRCLQRARQDAGLGPGQTDLIITHGTGTPAGDAAELEALAASSQGHPVAGVSNKPLVGHTGWSAGIVSVIHALLVLEHGSVPGQFGYTDPADHPAIGTAVDVPAGARPLGSPGRPPTVGVSSFGFGGTNAHLLLTHSSASESPDAKQGTDMKQGPDAGWSAPETDPVVLVAWSAHLPGEPDADAVKRLLADGVWDGPRDFGPAYPIPPFDEIRVPARTARALDRGQLMVLRVAAAFAAEHGELWEPVRSRTGVVAAHTGPPPAAVDNLLRCYADDLSGLFDGPDAEAFRSFVAEARAVIPATAKDTLPGFMPNILASRLAGRHDLHGPALLVDSGPDSGRSALRAAVCYLRAGDMDLALVVGVSTVVRPELAALIGADPQTHTEGAFMLALARRSIAERHGWPVVARVEERFDERLKERFNERLDEGRIGGLAAAGTPPAKSEHQPAGASFLAADALVDLLRSIP